MHLVMQYFNQQNCSSVKMTGYGLGKSSCNFQVSIFGAGFSLKLFQQRLYHVQAKYILAGLYKNQPNLYQQSFTSKLETMVLGTNIFSIASYVQYFFQFHIFFKTRRMDQSRGIKLTSSWLHHMTYWDPLPLLNWLQAWPVVARRGHRLVV